DKGSMLAALVFDVELAAFGNDQGMVAGNPGIGYRQVLFDLSSDAERAVVKVQGALFISVNKDQAGKHSRSDPRNRADDSLSSHGALDRKSTRLNSSH